MFVSVKEAVDLTGMSQTTIYRLCKKRSHTKYVRKKDNKYFIEKDYLLATYPETIENDSDNLEDEIERTALSTPSDDIIEFNDTPSAELSDKIIDDISVKITQRFNEANNLVIENTKGISSQNSKINWETVIGVSIGLLLIIGFILVLYWGTK